MTKAKLSINKLLIDLTDQLSAVSTTPRLDAELLLARACQCTREALYINHHSTLTDEQFAQLDRDISARRMGKPVALIIGEQAFWSLSLKVTEDTLIPRPETEHLIEWVLEHGLANQSVKDSVYIAELGTGSGAIAIALACERPNWHIHATDLSDAALRVAQYNAAKYDLNNISFYRGDWCEALPLHGYTLMISNPPYLASDDPHIESLRFEPRQALVAKQQGLADLAIIIQQALGYLVPGGQLVLEHGCTQAVVVRDVLAAAGYSHITTHVDLAGLDRFTTASVD